MGQTLQIVPTVSLQWMQQDAQPLSTIGDSKTLTWNAQLGFGTGPSQCDRLWKDQRVVAAGGNDDLDLTGLEASYFDNPAVISMARVRGIMLFNLNTESEDHLFLDSSVANAYLGPFESSATAKASCGPGSPLVLMNLVDGFGATSLTNKILRVAAPGANPVTYQIVIFGTSE